MTLDLGDTWATFNDDGTQRLALGRRWAPGPLILFTGANPSKAGASKNDPTSLRWIHFGQSWGYGGYIAVNQIPYISPTPRDAQQWLMRRQFGDATIDRDLEHNLALISKHAGDCALHVACWGSIICVDETLIERVIKAIGKPLYCLGINNDGSPKHPMARGITRVPDSQQPILWRTA